MKVRVLLFFIAFGFFSCAEKKSNELPESAPEAVNESEFAEGLHKVLEAHGGLNNWKTLGSYGFTVVAEEKNISFKTNLKKRKTIVEGSDFSLGFGSGVNWTFDEASTFNEQLYSKYSSTFYGATMPFNFIQDGAFYTQRLDVELFRVNYGVIHIGFGRGSGKSSDDEYVIYYDKETHQIAWLAYRVVEQGRYKRKYWEFIKYTSFQNVNGLLLPEKWTLYNASGNQPSKQLYTVEVTELILSEEPLSDSVFDAPEGSVFK